MTDSEFFATPVYPFRTTTVWTDANFEASAWLREHCPNDYYVESVMFPTEGNLFKNVRLAFKFEADAVAYKLRFGGE